MHTHLHTHPYSDYYYPTPIIYPPLNTHSVATYLYLTFPSIFLFKDSLFFFSGMSVSDHGFEAIYWNLLISTVDGQLKAMTLTLVESISNQLFSSKLQDILRAPYLSMTD